MRSTSQVKVNMRKNSVPSGCVIYICAHVNFLPLKYLIWVYFWGNRCPCQPSVFSTWNMRVIRGPFFSCFNWKLPYEHNWIKERPAWPAQPSPSSRACPPRRSRKCGSLRCISFFNTFDWLHTWKIVPRFRRHSVRDSQSDSEQFWYEYSTLLYEMPSN